MRKRVSKSDTTAHLTWPVVLGFQEPDVVGWPRVRAAQFTEMARLLPVICLINVANAVTLAA